MAVNYSAGLNPMYDRFSQQIQQASNTQKQAQMLAMQRENNRYQKLAELGGAIGSAVRSNAKTEVDQFKKDTSAEQKRLETLRDKFTIGSDSYLKLNNQIAGMKDKRDEQIQAYSDSGFLGFGRDSEELDLYKKDEAKKEESGKGFLRSAFEGNKRDTKGMFKEKKAVTNNSESRIAQNNEAIAKKREAIEKVRTANNPGTDPMGNPMGVPLSAEKSEQLTGLATGLAGEINSLERENKKLMKSVDNPKNVEKEEKKQRFLGEGFTDPNSGVQLNNRDLVTQEQRRYQENKEKEAREVQKKEARITRSAKTKLKLGMNLNEDERAYYQDFNEEEFTELQQEAQEPEFRQKITDAITFGKKFDLGDPKTQKIAESMNISGEELNDFIDEQYEEELYKDIQRSGDDFEALDKIAKKAEGRNLPTLTGSRMNILIEEAKQSQRDTIYGGLGTVLKSSDPAGALQAFEYRYGEKAKYLIDSEVINLGDYNKLLGSVRSRASKSATEADVKTKKSLFGLLDKNLEAYATLAQSGKPVDDALKGEIQSLAKQLDLDGNALMSDGASQESYKRQRAKINDISQKLSIENSVSRKLYNDVFGSGQSVDFKGFREDGSPSFDLKEKQGQLDPVKLRNSFISQYTRANMGTSPTTGQVDAFVEEMINYNKVIRLGLTPSIRESRIQDSIKQNN